MMSRKGILYFFRSQESLDPGTGNSATSPTTA